MSLESVPRFDPGRSIPSQQLERRRRVLVLVGGALVLALLGASVANAQRASLRCIDGRLVPHQGRLLPLGEEPIEDPRLAPLRAETCEDETFDSLGAMETRYLEIAMGRADEAIRTDDREALEKSLHALEGLPVGADESLAQRYRQLLAALLRVEVQRAHDSRQQALQRIEQAREAGVDEAALRKAEQALGLTQGAIVEAPEPVAAAPEPPPADEPPRVVEPPPPAAPREL